MDRDHVHHSSQHASGQVQNVEMTADEAPSFFTNKTHGTERRGYSKGRRHSSQCHICNMKSYCKDILRQSGKGAHTLGLGDKGTMGLEAVVITLTH